MKFVLDVTAFNRAKTITVDAANVAEALRKACEETNITVKIREIEDLDPAQVEGLRSIP